MTNQMQFRNAVVSHNGNGDNLVIAAVAGQVIKVWRCDITAGAAVSVTMKDGAGGTALSGAYNLPAAGAPLALPYDGAPLWVTSPGNAFNMSTSSGVLLTGNLAHTLGG
jgi:hypothetical protein